MICDCNLVWFWVLKFVYVIVVYKSFIYIVCNLVSVVVILGFINLLLRIDLFVFVICNDF